MKARKKYGARPGGIRRIVGVKARVNEDLFFSLQKKLAQYNQGWGRPISEFTHMKSNSGARLEREWREKDAKTSD